jgi:1,4-alpha-glucan branching enzyme
MGWMHDTLQFFARDHELRLRHCAQLTHRMSYAFDEKFVLALSHDEVVHEKGSLLSRMPGDEWRKFSNLRLLFAYMYALPGKKLLFMGGEFAQVREWSHEMSLDWDLLESGDHVELHRGMQSCIRDLNFLIRQSPALHELDFDRDGFEWLIGQNSGDGILAFLRRARTYEERIIFLFNLTPIPIFNYRLGFPRQSTWRLLLNTDAKVYGGSGIGDRDRLRSNPVPAHGHFHSLNLDIPPLGALFLGSVTLHP